eukprot:jgi/Mesvir1/17820/Mv12915-RA.1
MRYLWMPLGHSSGLHRSCVLLTNECGLGYRNEGRSCLNQKFAQRLHDALQQKGTPGEEGLVLELNLEDNGREGTFTVGGQALPAVLLDLPCVVESFKTRDENHLVKSADIGQMIMVAESMADIQAVTEAEHRCRHGITPPMRDVRRRRFAKHREFDGDGDGTLDDEQDDDALGGDDGGGDKMDLDNGSP